MNTDSTDAPRVERSVAGLAAARKAQNLSIADVARQLRLSAGQVEALEAGEFEKLPGPVFVRGFIRNYARLLGIDADAILHSIQHELPPQQVVEAPPSHDIPFPSRPATRWRGYAVALLAVAVAVTAYELYWSEPGAVTVTKKSEPRPEVVPARTPQIGTGNALPLNSAAQPTGVQGAVPEAAAGLQPARESGGAPPAPAAKPAAALKSELEGRLHFVFALDSWVEIRDGRGKIVFSRLNPGGSEQRVSGIPPLSLVVGNARGVRLTYNERPIDLGPHTNVSVARLTIE